MANIMTHVPVSLRLCLCPGLPCLHVCLMKVSACCRLGTVVRPAAEANTGEPTGQRRPAPRPRAWCSDEPPTQHRHPLPSPSSAARLGPAVRSSPQPLTAGTGCATTTISMPAGLSCSGPMGTCSMSIPRFRRLLRTTRQLALLITSFNSLHVSEATHSTQPRQHWHPSTRCSAILRSSTWSKALVLMPDPSAPPLRRKRSASPAASSASRLVQTP